MGMFANIAVSKGELLMILGGYIMRIEDEPVFPNGKRDLALQINEQFVIGPKYEHEIEEVDFVNHSCDPNSGIKGQIVLVALRDIGVDEEITFDYAMVLHEPDRFKTNYEEGFECDCGSARCRGRITYNDWKLPELQERYNGFFSQYIQDKIDDIRRGGEHETRDQRPETRDQRPETRDQRPETRDQRPETRDQRHFPQALIEIRCSKLLEGEIGLFAVRDLKGGTIIGHVERFGEELYTWDDYDKLDRQTKRMVDKFCASTKDGFWGPEDINYIPPCWHMNHSCGGNVGFDKDDNFVAIRDVKEDEELCFDYGLLISNPSFRLECKCGSPECRGTVTGNDWQDPKFKRRNIHYMSEGILKLYSQDLDAR